MFYYELKFDDYQNMVLSVNNVGMKVKSCRFVMIPNMPKLCFYKYNIFISLTKCTLSFSCEYI